MNKPRRPNVDWIPFGSLAFDERIQRGTIWARVKHLNANWDLEGVGIITVSLRADARYYVIDGQHRIRAAMEKSLGDTKAKCHIYRGLTLQEEAEKFLVLNDSRTVTPLDKYAIGLIARNPLYLGIQAILDEFGVRVGSNMLDGQVRAVGELIAIYKRDPQLLKDTLRTAIDSWGTRGASFELVVLAALSKVLQRYNGEVDRATLISKLAHFKGGPAGLVGSARGLAEVKPTLSVRAAAAELVVDTYNKGRRTKALPPL